MSKIFSSELSDQSLFHAAFSMDLSQNRQLFADLKEKMNLFAREEAHKHIFSHTVINTPFGPLEWASTSNPEEERKFDKAYKALALTGVAGALIYSQGFNAITAVVNAVATVMLLDAVLEF